MKSSTEDQVLKSGLKLSQVSFRPLESPQIFPGSNKYAENLTTTKTDSLDIEFEENRAKKIAELQSLSDQDLLHKMQKLKQRAYR